MRAFLFMVGISVLFVVAAIAPAGAAGMYTPGKEDCACPSLVAEGTVPDTLNTLADIPRALRVAELLEFVSDGVKTFLQQAGAQPTQAEAAPAVETAPPAEKPAVEKSSVEKSSVEKTAEKAVKEKPVKKLKKDKKVKRPSAKI